MINGPWDDDNDGEQSLSPALKKRKRGHDRGLVASKRLTTPTSDFAAETPSWYADSDSDGDNISETRAAALSQGPLFSFINTRLSAIATDQQRVIIDAIKQRANGTELCNVKL